MRLVLLFLLFISFSVVALEKINDYVSDDAAQIIKEFAKLQNNSKELDHYNMRVFAKNNQAVFLLGENHLQTNSTIKHGFRVAKLFKHRLLEGVDLREKYFIGGILSRFDTIDRNQQLISNGDVCIFSAMCAYYWWWFYWVEWPTNSLIRALEFADGSIISAAGRFSFYNSEGSLQHLFPSCVRNSKGMKALDRATALIGVSFINHGLEDCFSINRPLAWEEFAKFTEDDYVLDKRENRFVFNILRVMKLLPKEKAFLVVQGRDHNTGVALLLQKKGFSEVPIE